jgi:hypothetical protein
VTLLDGRCDLLRPENLHLGDSRVGNRRVILSIARPTDR